MTVEEWNNLEWSEQTRLYQSSARGVQGWNDRTPIYITSRIDSINKLFSRLEELPTISLRTVFLDDAWFDPPTPMTQYLDLSLRNKVIINLVDGQTVFKQVKNDFEITWRDLEPLSLDELDILKMIFRYIPEMRIDKSELFRRRSFGLPTMG